MNRKVFIIIVIIVLTNSLFCQNSDIFQIDRYSFEIDSLITSAAYYDNCFYCTSGKNLLIIDSENHLTFSSIKIPKLKYLITRHDTLFGINGNDSIYFYSDSSFIFKKQDREEFNRFIDDRFVISSICNGEFGGVIYFKDKENGRTYKTYAHCLMDIDKIEYSYLITTSVYGATSLFKINNPFDLICIPTNNEKKWRKKRKEIKIISIDEYNKELYSNFLESAEILWQKKNHTIIHTFQNKNKLFQIVHECWMLGNQNDRTFISTFQNDTIIEIEELIDNEAIYNWDLELSKLNNLSLNEHFITTFKGSKSLSWDTSGFIFIDNEKIKIFEFLKK